MTRADALFAIEREINGKTPSERRRVRQERSRPRVEALEAWLRQQYDRLSPNSQVAKAIAYSLNRWDDLARFLDDGRLCMTNNAAERALRGIAVGRHNWTFAGSDAGGRRAAAIYTLIDAIAAQCSASASELANRAFLRVSAKGRMVRSTTLLSISKCPSSRKRLRPCQRDRVYRIASAIGVGKSWLACALGNNACRDERSVLYQRVPKLFPDLALARGDAADEEAWQGRLLILDDWGLEPLGPDQRRDLLEFVEERYGRGATDITSQIPVDRWHDIIGEPTIADAILDRIVHNAHRLKLNGDSLRRKLTSQQPVA